jgi:hypothetical protein
MTASNMTLAAFTGTPVLDDGKVAIRSLAEGQTFMGEQQATESIVNPKRTTFYVASFTFSGEAVAGMTFAYTGFRCSPTGDRKGDQQVGLCARSASVDERWLYSTVADASSSFVFGVRPRAQARGSFAHDEEGRFSQRLPRTQ